METSKRLKAALSGVPAAERRRFARECAALPPFDSERDMTAEVVIVPSPQQCSCGGWGCFLCGLPEMEGEDPS